MYVILDLVNCSTKGLVRFILPLFSCELEVEEEAAGRCALKCSVRGKVLAVLFVYSSKMELLRLEFWAWSSINLSTNLFVVFTAISRHTDRPIKSSKMVVVIVSHFSCFLVVFLWGPHLRGAWGYFWLCAGCYMEKTWDPWNLSLLQEKHKSSSPGSYILISFLFLLEGETSHYQLRSAWGWVCTGKI